MPNTVTRLVRQAGPMDDLFEPDEAAPICPSCGVTALPGEADDFVCENPDCPAFGEPVR